MLLSDRLYIVNMFRQLNGYVEYEEACFQQGLRHPVTAPSDQARVRKIRALVNHKECAADVKRMHDAGMKTREIAERLNLAISTVDKVKARLGIASGRCFDHGEHDRQVRRLHDLGLGPKEIARRLGLTESVVLAAKARLGIRKKYATRKRRDAV